MGEKGARGRAWLAEGTEDAQAQGEPARCVKATEMRPLWSEGHERERESQGGGNDIGEAGRSQGVTWWTAYWPHPGVLILY